MLASFCQELMIFALGGQYSETPRSLASFCPLVVMWMSIILPARGLVSALHLFSVKRGLSRKDGHLLKFCQINVSLKFSDVCPEGRKGAPVLVSPSAGFLL